MGMSKVEAIAILDGFKYNPLLNEQHFEALDMAISALEKNESAGEWYKLFCEKWDEGDLVYNFPKGTTNGEVIQALFPCDTIKLEDGWVCTSLDKFTAFTAEWWNAPYQKGGE